MQNHIQYIYVYIKASIHIAKYERIILKHLIELYIQWTKAYAMNPAIYTVLCDGKAEKSFKQANAPLKKNV